jgi:GNAT superfamily N-acetyltransferase
MEGLCVRRLAAEDPPVIAAAFAAIGWTTKPVERFEHFLVEQASDTRHCWVATVDDDFAGYVTLVVHPTYPPLVGTGIPEIQDLNVLPQYRRRRIATKLLDEAEAEASRRSRTVAIGVGLHPGYNAAQRLYVLRGYVPDGLGVTHGDRYIAERETLMFDDELVLHFTRDL